MTGAMDRIADALDRIATATEITGIRLDPLIAELDRIATALEAQTKTSDFLNVALLPEQDEREPVYGLLQAKEIDWCMGFDGKTLMVIDAGAMRPATDAEAEAIRARPRPTERRAR